MATAILDVLEANKTIRGVSRGPSSLAWKIGSLIKSTRLHPRPENHKTYHPTTIELNAAFLEMISEEPPNEAKALLEEWAIYCIGSYWGGSTLDPQGHLAVLTALFFFVSSGVQEIIQIQEDSIKDQGNGSGGLPNGEQVLRAVQKMRDNTRQALAEATLGRRLTDEGEIVFLMDNTLP